MPPQFSPEARADGTPVSDVLSLHGNVVGDALSARLEQDLTQDFELPFTPLRLLGSYDNLPEGAPLITHDTGWVAIYTTRYQRMPMIVCACSPEIPSNLGNADHSEISLFGLGFAPSNQGLKAIMTVEQKEQIEAGGLIYPYYLGGMNGYLSSVADVVRQGELSLHQR